MRRDRTPPATPARRSAARLAWVALIGLIGPLACSDAPTPEEERGGTSSRNSGGRWDPPSAVAPNGVGSYEGVGGEGCSGGLRPGAKKLGDQLKARFGFSTYGGYSCRANTANPSQLSVHAVGRALDLMTTDGDPIADHLVKNASALGVQLIIWNRTSWRVNASGASSKAYGGPHPHTDHVHVELTVEAAENGAGDVPNDSADEPSAPRNDPPTGTIPDSDRCGSAEDACREAVALGQTCGTVRDACSRIVSCTGAPFSLVCGAGETCGANNRCVKTACVPRAAADVCADAKITGATCGSFPDGCGGTLSCNGVAGLGCPANQRCNVRNQCESAGGTTSPTAPGRNEPAEGDDPPEEMGKEPKDSDDATSDRTPTNRSGKAPADKKPSASSGGCASAPPGTAGTSSLPIGALVLGLCLLGRRRRRPQP